MSKKSEKEKQVADDIQYVNDNGYIIKSDTHTNSDGVSTQWHWLYEKDTGMLVKSYRHISGAIKKAKALINQKNYLETVRIERLKNQGALELCRMMKSKLPVLRELNDFMRQNQSEAEYVDGAHDVAQQLLYLNGDLNHLESRLNNLEIFILRLKNPQYGMINNKGENDGTD